ncbi:MAG: DUF4230 domain-containing protein [Anaerofustis stercorihominis]|nr:DUF4230 domain-containing protein [Anaerofustis stercorihominis]
MILVIVVGLLCFGSYVMGQKDIPELDQPIGGGVVSESETKQLSFENIGELVTQEAICTEVNITDSSRELFGIKIPFTQTKYIYSYDVVIKAGFDFSQIEYIVTDNVIEVIMPEPKVMSNELKTETFKMYYEKESAFKRISLEENNEALNKLRQNAEKSAVENGIFDNAKTNAEIILRGFFAQAYDPEEYTVTFTYGTPSSDADADTDIQSSEQNNNTEVQ